MSRWFEILGDKDVLDEATRVVALEKHGVSKEEFVDIIVAELEADNHLLAAGLASLYAYFITETESNVSTEAMLRLSKIVDPNSKYQMAVKFAAYTCLYAINQSVANLVVSRADSFAYLCMVVKLILLSSGIAGPQMVITMLLHTKGEDDFLQFITIVEVVRESIGKRMEDVYVVPAIPEAIMLIGQIVACVLLVGVDPADRPKLKLLSLDTLLDNSRPNIEDIRKMFADKNLSNQSLAAVRDVIGYLENMIDDEFVEASPSDIEELRKNIQ